MSSLVINGSTPFGGMSNQMIESIWAVDQAITRLAAAVSVAQSGFSGTAGTEFETGTNFGVAPSAVPGDQGAAFAYAIGVLAGDWANFKSTALASIEQLDNG